MNVNHGLYKLSESIDWASLEKEIAHLISDQHQSHWRLVSASIYLKSFYDLSTADLIKKWLECPYYRFFCTGEASEVSDNKFPVPQEVLEQLSLDLAGEGYDAMIKALSPKATANLHQSRLSSTMH